MAHISRPFQYAVKAMVEAAVPTFQYHYGGVKVPDAELAYPYIVQWPVPAVGFIANLGGNLIPRINDVRFVVCGKDSDEVLWALDELGDALRGERPVIEGWGCNFLREISEGQPVSENTEILFDGRPTYRGWAHYRMGAEPAPVIGS